MARTLEERLVRVDLARSKEMIASAFSRALEIPLDSPAPAMWTGATNWDRWTDLEVVVRALPNSAGTSIRIELTHVQKPISFLWGVAAMFSIPLVFPFFWLIARAHRTAQAQERQRSVVMHKLWSELHSVLSTERGYRETRLRVADEAVHEELLSRETTQGSSA